MNMITANGLSITYSIPSYNYTSFKELILNSWRQRQPPQRIHAVRDVSFTIARGESVALLGHNGCGKSTLLKAIAGVIRVPTQTLSTVGRVAPMIELGAGFDGELSGYENILLSCMILGLTREEVLQRLDSIVSFAELQEFITLPVKNYSSGMYARLGFACATAVQPDILLIDEVLSVGDANFGAKCLTRIHELQASGTTIVLVSHDMNTVKRFCSRGIVLERGLLRFDGPIRDAVRCHESILDDQRLAALSADEAAEVKRLARLDANVADQAQGKAAPTPNVLISFKLNQNDQEVESIDLARPFHIDLALLIEGGDRFHDDISVGIGLHLPVSHRLGGCNNLQRGIRLPRDRFVSEKRLVVRFTFAEGIPLLAGREYELIAGIHDEAIARNVTTLSLGVFTATNSRLGPNTDVDVVGLKEFNTDVTLL